MRGEESFPVSMSNRGDSKGGPLKRTLIPQYPTVVKHGRRFDCTMVEHSGEYCGMSNLGYT